MIKAVTPSLAVPGGELRLDCEAFVPGLPDRAQALFGDTRAEIGSASGDRVFVRVPDGSEAPGVRLRSGESESAVFPFTVGKRIASGLHPVTSPVVAPDGSVITTISGTRGQQVPQPVVRVTRDGVKTPYSCEITNPTGLAFGPDRQLYISSRNDGTVLRFRDFEELEPVAEELGIACGIVFDSAGNLFVGDRTGHVYRIDPSGYKEEFARLDPSVAAFHMAIDASDNLYVTAPSFSLRDVLYRINPQGKITVLIEGLARPQGLAVDPEGDILLAASWHGRKGIFRYSPARAEMCHFIAGPMLVGLALAGDGFYLADGNSIYWLPAGGFTRRMI